MGKVSINQSPVDIPGHSDIVSVNTKAALSFVQSNFICVAAFTQGGEKIDMKDSKLLTNI